MATYQKDGPTITTEVASDNFNVRIYNSEADMEPPKELRFTVVLQTSVGRDKVDMDVDSSSLTAQQKTDLATILGVLRDDALTAKSYSAA